MVDTSSSEFINVQFTKITLANGLDVIVHEDHGCPIVAVNIWYHVGSKNERPGLTGFAHLFEHLMFEGSAHHDHGYFEPLQQAGALLNGSTSTDRTNYWEVVPTNALELALWLESDRMGFLVPALSERKFANQRDVVLNERRQNYENRPYGRAPIALSAALYPPSHPYHWPTIGRTEDIRSARLDDAAAFCRTYYHPGNASLALAGDIETKRALDLVEQYFGELAAGPERPPVVLPEIAAGGEQRLVFEDRVELPRLYLAWRTPAMFAPEDAALDLLSELLANYKTSRLFRRLVQERRLATEVVASQGSREASSLFSVVATAAPGRSLDELEAVIREEMGDLASRGPSADELERVRARAEADFVYRLQTVGGFGGKSDLLNAYNTYLGDPGSFTRDLERYLVVDQARIRTIAAECLPPGARVALSVVPTGGRNLALAGSVPTEAA